jgi:hypothetical protein
VRSRDLHAIAVQDRTFVEGPYVDRDCPIDTGRLASSGGLDLAPAEYEEHFVEEQAPPLHRAALPPARRRLLSGHGWTEAPRGLLYHRYSLDEEGTVQLGEPTALLDAWDDEPEVIVVDASGPAPSPERCIGSMPGWARCPRGCSKPRRST